MRLLAAAFILPLLASGDSVSADICRQRLADISHGHISGDDELVIERCIILGFIDGEMVKDAYRDALKARSAQ